MVALQSKITVAVFCGDRISAELVELGLSSFDRIEVSHVFCDPGKLLKELPAVRPHVVLVDTRPFSGPDFASFAARLKSVAGTSGMIVLIDQSAEAAAAEIMRSIEPEWSCLFLHTLKGIDDLARIVDSTARGFTIRDPELENHVQNEHNDILAPLTDAEREILELIAQGLNNKFIADKLFLSVRTVESHISSVYQKLNIATDDAMVDPRVAAVLTYMRAKGKM